MCIRDSDRDQLKEIAEGIATEDSELPDGIELDRILDAASGLTRAEAESAFSLSRCVTGRSLPRRHGSRKSRRLKRVGCLSFTKATRALTTSGASMP